MLIKFENNNPPLSFKKKGIFFNILDMRVSRLKGLEYGGGNEMEF